MKSSQLFLMFALLFFITTSCVSVRVASDYDQQVDFNEYKSFAFFKPGIDKAEISDLDKKRILRAIEVKMIEKGFSKSEKPDLLISIFTKERERINNNSNWGYNPWMWGPYPNTTSTRIEGSLYIDFLDAKKKELIWQGKGTGSLIMDNVEEKQERINRFVDKILDEYPPESSK